MMPGTDQLPSSPVNNTFQPDSLNFGDIITIRPPSAPVPPIVESATRNREELSTVPVSSSMHHGTVQERSGIPVAIKNSVPGLLSDNSRKVSQPQNTCNLNVDTLLFLNRCATVIQATWRGYSSRKRHITDIRSVRSMAKLRCQVEALAEEVERNRTFQSVVLQILAQLVSQQQNRQLMTGFDSCNSTQQSLNDHPLRNTDETWVQNDMVPQNLNSQPPLKDTLTELRNEFSRMSAQFASDSHAVDSSHLISEAADPNNDTSTSSLRVVSLTEEDMISQWGVDDGCHDNGGTGTDCDEDLNEDEEREGDNANDSTFTESEQVRKLLS